MAGRLALFLYSFCFLTVFGNSLIILAVLRVSGQPASDLMAQILKGPSSEMDAILFLHHSIGLPLAKACAAKTQTFIKGTVHNEH